MKLYYRRNLVQGSMLLSYVDDSTILVQSLSLQANVSSLRKAYALVFELFTALGLALEHDKTELMHFDRSNNRKDNPVLDLTPITGVRENYIKPKVHWRYLGFYFDRKLTFREHVRYYSTKALTTVKAMGMLGNSARGLSAYQKRLLYCTCVVPIATYGYKLWSFEGS